MSTRPDLADVLAGLRVVNLPMRVRFRGLTHREVALIPGPLGWGEFGAFGEYAPREAARWLAAALEAAFEGWPQPVRTQVPVNATVPAVPAARVSEVLARFTGCTTAKVKVAQAGQGLRDDLDRVAAVRERLGPAGTVRVDANGAWDLPQARHALAALSTYHLEYAEQPCADVHDLARLRTALARDGVEVPIAADESIRRAQDPMLVRDLAAADIIVVKAAPLGGVARSLQVVADCGLPAVVSSALDTSVGISTGVALAAALPTLEHACGLGTLALLDGDVSGEPLVAREGALRPRRVRVDEELLGRHAAAPERLRWWRDRVVACWDHLP